jgi:4-amino-4-deoxy-L-arabinose transferase-like glycosyltransferase
LFGAFTAILIFLVASELFGVEVGLISAGLWTLDLVAISFNRIAKEDTFLVFFFLLASVFWLRGQRVAESQPHRNAQNFYWATAAAMGAMFASKYVLVMLAIIVSYNYTFQGIPTRWVMGKVRYIKFFLIMGFAFVICNPAILLPGTWRAMANFISYRTMGHDSYEFMGQLYPHKFTDWLRGEPWYFYFVLLLTKVPILTLLGLASGLPLLFRRKTGDGRYFLLAWLSLWALAFMPPGGKFARYVTSLMPMAIMTAALGVHFIASQLGRLSAHVFKNPSVKTYTSTALASLFIVSAFWSAVRAAPHYRLYMNALGGGPANAGNYFPQDEFYDAYVRDAIIEIAKRAPAGAHVASEIKTVAEYYATQEHRPDLVCVLLSDPVGLQELRPGDFLIDGRGRFYISNQEMLHRLRQTSTPAFTVAVGKTTAAYVYVLDENSLAALRGR